MDGVGGEHDRAAVAVDEQHGLPRRVAADADRLDAGRDLAVAVEQSNAAVARQRDPLDLGRLDVRRELRARCASGLVQNSSSLRWTTSSAFGKASTLPVWS